MSEPRVWLCDSETLNYHGYHLKQTGFDFCVRKYPDKFIHTPLFERVGRPASSTAGLQVMAVLAWESKHCACDGPEETGGAPFVCFLHQIPDMAHRNRALTQEQQTRIGELIEALRCIA